jgi:hypothetical protein
MDVVLLRRATRLGVDCGGSLGQDGAGGMIVAVVVMGARQHVRCRFVVAPYGKMGRAA